MASSKVKYIFKICFFLICFIFVVHRGYKCFGKFLAAPVTGLTNNHFSGGFPFPTIGFSREKGAFKEETLKVCNLTLEDYDLNAKWTGIGNESYCSDAKELYKMAFWHPRDLMSLVIIYKTFGGDLITEYDPNALKILPTPGIPRGLRVEFVLHIPQQLIVKGIARIEIFFFGNPLPEFWIFVHQPGSRLMDLPKNPERLFLAPNVHTEVTVDYEIITQLDFDGVPCNASKDYSFDDCVQDYIYHQAMKKVGCATIHGTDLNDLCNSTEKATEAMKLYNETKQESFTNWCKYPCTYMDISLTNKKTANHGSGDFQSHIAFNFKKFVCH